MTLLQLAVRMGMRGRWCRLRSLLRPLMAEVSLLKAEQEMIWNTGDGIPGEVVVQNAEYDYEDDEMDVS